MEQAKAIDWFIPPKNGITKDDSGLYRWFDGARLNTSYLALDYHVNNGRADQDALIYESPVTYESHTYSYRELLSETELLAGLLKDQGVVKGDTVIIYMPMIPQVVFAMLACARLGAVHSVVFGGFAARELAIRIDDAKPRILLTASGSVEIKRVIQYKPLVDEALDLANYKVDKVIVWQRPRFSDFGDHNCYGYYRPRMRFDYYLQPARPSSIIRILPISFSISIRCTSYTVNTN